MSNGGEMKIILNIEEATKIIEDHILGTYHFDLDGKLYELNQEYIRGSFVFEIKDRFEEDKH